MLNEDELKILKEESDKDSKAIRAKMSVELTDQELQELVLKMSSKLSNIKSEEITLDDIKILESIYLNVTLRAHTYDLVVGNKELTKYFNLLWKSLTPLHKAYGLTLAFGNMIANNRGFAQYNALSDKEKEDLNNAVKKMRGNVSTLDDDDDDDDDDFEDTPLEQEYDDPEEDDKPSLSSAFDMFREAQDKKKNKG